MSDSQEMSRNSMNLVNIVTTKGPHTPPTLPDHTTPEPIHSEQQFESDIDNDHRIAHQPVHQEGPRRSDYESLDSRKNRYAESKRQSVHQARLPYYIKDKNKCARQPSTRRYTTTSRRNGRDQYNPEQMNVSRIKYQYNELTEFPSNNINEQRYKSRSRSLDLHQQMPISKSPDRSYEYRQHRYKSRSRSLDVHQRLISESTNWSNSYRQSRNKSRSRSLDVHQRPISESLSNGYRQSRNKSRSRSSNRSRHYSKSTAINERNGHGQKSFPNLESEASKRFQIKQGPHSSQSFNKSQRKYQNKLKSKSKSTTPPQPQKSPTVIFHNEDPNQMQPYSFRPFIISPRFFCPPMVYRRPPPHMGPRFHVRPTFFFPRPPPWVSPLPYYRPRNFHEY